jgi:hypothetical protein
MRHRVLILCATLIFCLSNNTKAANRFWRASAAGNWNNTANWSNVSGGAGGFSVPGALDAVTFDGGGLGNCIINQAVNITSINVKAAYTGTITQGTNTITTSGVGTFSGGTFSGGSANINIQGVFTLSGTAFTSTSAILEFNSNAAFTSGVFTHNNGTVRFNTTVGATQTISGTSPSLYSAEFVGLGRTYRITSVGNLTVTNALNLTGSAFATINTGTIEVLGDINITNTATGGGGTATITIDGTGTQNINGSTASGYGALPKVIINKASGTLNLFSNISFSGNLTYTAGTINAGTSTVYIVNTLTITGSFSVYNFSIDGTAVLTVTIASGSTVTVTNQLEFDNGANNITINTGSIAAQGNIIDNNTGLSGGGTATILINGSSSQTITSTGVLDQGKFPAVNISSTGGTVTFPLLITVTGNWTYTSGTMDVTTNNSTIVFENSLTITGTHTLNNVTFNANANYTDIISTGTLLTVTGTLLTMGSANLLLNTPTAATTAIEAQGDITINNTGTTGGGNGGLLIDGTANQAFSSTSASGQGWLPYINIQKTGGILTMSGTISETRNWTYTSGTVDAVTNTSTVVFGNHNLTVKSNGMSFYNVNVISSTTTLGNDMTASGDLTISGTGVLVANAHTINLAGNWTDYGTGGFTEGTSTVNLDGSSLQTIATPGGEDFYNLTSANSGTGSFLSDDINIANRLRMTSGNIDLNGNTVTLGNSTANIGILTHTSGSLINAGYFTRWFNTSTIADGNVAGLFPMGVVTDVRPFNIAAPTTAPTSGGTITVSHTYINDWRYIFVTDVDATVLLTENDSYWTVTTGNGLTGGNYDLRGAGTGFGIINSINDLRLILQSSVVGNPAANGGTTTDPQVNRTNVSLTDLNNSFFIATKDAADVLPINLMSFTANVINNKVALHWQIAKEINVDYFTVQRSKDGMNWETIAKVTANGASSNGIVSYSIDDANPYEGASYYRIIEVDTDGRQTYSEIRLVNFESTFSAITVYPNPATGNINISLPQTGNYLIKLINANGQLINNYAIANSDNILLNVSSIPAGVYFIHILYGKNFETKKITIRR